MRTPSIAGLARKGINVTLAEIDPYTCALIAGISQAEKLPVTIHQIDLRNPLPPKIVGKFDLFVADPDFTIYAFGLFLLRGLSALKPNGIGLINFENSKAQSTKARLLLQALNIDIVNEFTEPWTYVILRNIDVAVGSSGYGKYSYVDYETEIELGEASYTSVMFVVKKTDQTKQILQANQTFDDPTQSIYDY